jgi:hypothetical protein
MVPKQIGRIKKQSKRPRYFDVYDKRKNGKKGKGQPESGECHMEIKNKNVSRER